MFDDDAIERALSGPSAQDYSHCDEKQEVLAETTIRVDLGAWLGELELHIPDRPDERGECGDALIYAYVPDAGNLEPSQAQKDCLTLRVRDLDRIVRALQLAIARARTMRVIPAAEAGVP